MADWWDILNVDKDADLRTIKRAYATKVKIIRQDENPTEFIELREAYDIAKNWEFKQTNDQVPNQTCDIKDAPVNHLDNEVTRKLLEKADEIIADWSTRRDVKQWQALLDQLDDLNIDQHADFEHYFFQILTSWYNECFDPDTGEINNSQATEYQIGMEATHLIYRHFGWGQTNFMSNNSSALKTLHFLMSGLPMENRYVALPGQNPEQETLPYQPPVETNQFNPILIIIMVLVFFGGLSNLLPEPTENKNSYEQLTSQPQVQKINCLEIADRWGQENNIQSLLNLDIPSTGKIDFTESILGVPATNNPLKLAQERQKVYQESTLPSSSRQNQKTVTLLSQFIDIDSDENLTMLALACGLITEKN